MILDLLPGLQGLSEEHWTYRLVFAEILLSCILFFLYSMLICWLLAIYARFRGRYLVCVQCQWPVGESPLHDMLVSSANIDARVVSKLFGRSFRE